MTGDERFWAKVEKTPTCWLWRGATYPNGYGITYRDKRRLLSHRVAYELTIGPLPQGQVLDHLCRVRECVNPDHLEVVSNRTNVLRGIGRSAINARKTHCKRGHELAGENLRVRIKDGREFRVCRTCRRAADSASRSTPEGREVRRQQQQRTRARHGAEYNERRRVKRASA